MTFRTVVKDGLIVINTHGEIPDGTPVEVVRLDTGAKKVAKKAGKRDRSRAKAKDPLPGFGGWKDRTDIKDAAEYARELRRRVSRRARNA
jgi:hypothetical protein